MEFKLKNIKYLAALSEETHCFSATVYKDGKRWCEVRDNGHGGEMEFVTLKGNHAQNELYHEVQEINKELNKTTYEYFDMTLKESLEGKISDLVNKWLAGKELKKILRKVAVVDKKGDIFSWSHKPTPEIIERLKESKQWEPDYKCLNEMKFEDALQYIK